MEPESNTMRTYVAEINGERSSRSARKAITRLTDIVNEKNGDLQRA